MTDDRRPDGLDENVVEPRCGDLVRFSHLDEPALFKVSVTNRFRHGENRYSFSEVHGDRVFNMDESEYVALYDTDKSALWPMVYAEVDLLSRRRDIDTGGITYYDEVTDAAKNRSAETVAEDGGRTVER